MVTIGVAVAIPEPWATQLQDYRTEVGDVMATSIPTHITLVPPTDIDDDDLASVQSHLADVAGESDPFRVHLRGTGTFRPVSPVVFVSLVEGISQCEQLADAVRRGPLRVDLAFPYHPHVTVAHHLEDDRLDRAFRELADFDCEFEVGDFHLYVHDQASGWQPAVDFRMRSHARRCGGDADALAQVGTRS